MAAERRRATAQNRGGDPALLRVQAVEPFPMGPENVRQLRVPFTGYPDRHGSGHRRFDVLDIGQQVVERTLRVPQKWPATGRRNDCPWPIISWDGEGREDSVGRFVRRVPGWRPQAPPGSGLVQ